MKKETKLRKGGIYKEQRTLFEPEAETPEEREAALRVASEEMEKPWDRQKDIQLLRFLHAKGTNEEMLGNRLVLWKEPYAKQAHEALNWFCSNETSSKQEEEAFRAGFAYAKALALLAEEAARQGRAMIKGREEAEGRGRKKQERLQDAFLRAWKDYLNQFGDYHWKAKVPNFFKWLKPKAKEYRIVCKWGKNGNLLRANKGRDKAEGSTIQRNWMDYFRNTLGYGKKPEDSQLYEFHTVPIEIEGEDDDGNFEWTDASAEMLANEWLHSEDRGALLAPD